MAFYFRLPVITDLTIEQQAVLNEPGPIAVSGGPGTGKSVVALWRHIRNHDTQKRKSLLLTYTKSLEAYLRASAMGESNPAAKCVNRTYYWTYHLAHRSGNQYDEIIIDEAQDVEEEKYHIINNCTPLVSFSADDNQMLYPNRGVSEFKLKSLFSGNNEFALHENFRNTNELVQFVRAMFPTRLISPGKSSGPKPTVICAGNSEEKQMQIIIDILNNFNSTTHNIAVLLPLQNQVTQWHQILTNKGIQCSKFVNNDGDIGMIDNIHVTTFKSAKGLEFDTVILPNFQFYEDNIKNLNVVDENDYYVVFTRARRNLMLIDNSENNGKACQLSFLSLTIQRGLVNVDLDYVDSPQGPPSTPSTPIKEWSDFDDDLPF